MTAGIETFDFTETTGDNSLVEAFNSSFPPVVYHGYTVHEDAGSAAVAEFAIEEREPDNTFVRVLDWVNLAANSSASAFYGEGIPLAPGISIYLNVIGGEYSGSVRFSDGKSLVGAMMENGDNLLLENGDLLLVE